MSPETQDFYEFGGFQLKPLNRNLRRNDRAVALSPKAFEALLVLVESGGRVVPRGELIERIWPDGEAGEANLAVLISALRKSLGERPDGGLYIETVPRQGYRFAAPVKRVGDFGLAAVLPDSAPVMASPVAGGLGNADGQSRLSATVQPASFSALADQPAPALPRLEAAPHEAALINAGSEREGRQTVTAAAGIRPSGSGARRKILWVALAAFVTIGALGYAALIKTTAVADAKPRRLAILPFRNLKPDTATDFLGGSLADSITTKLGSISSLIIRPSACVKQYRGDGFDPRRAASELNVDTLMTGTYLKEGDTLRITVLLIDADKGETMASLPLDTRYDKLLTVHEQVAENIIERLHMKLTLAEATRLKQKGTENAQAYEHYLQGLDLYLKNDFLASVPLLEKAVALDGDFALAWAHLGRARNACASFKLLGNDLHQRAQAAYDRALKLNPELTEAVIFKANLFTDTNRVEEAVPLLRHLLAAYPNNAEAHWEMGYAYRFAGMLEESIAEGEKARALDPLVKAGSSAFNSYLYTGQYARFLASLPAATDNAFLVFYRGVGNYYLKNWEGAAADFNRAYESDQQLYTQIGKALAYGLRNQRMEGIEMLRDVEQGVEQGSVGDAEGMFKVAQAYAALGDRTAALRMLRRSIEHGFFCYDYFKNDPLLEPLRREPEFTALLNKAQARHEQFRQMFF